MVNKVDKQALYTIKRAYGEKGIRTPGTITRTLH